MRTLRTLTDGGADHAFEVVGLPETMLQSRGSRSGRAQPPSSSGSRPRASTSSIAGDRVPLRTRGSAASYYGSGDPAVELPELARLALAGELDLAAS